MTEKLEELTLECKWLKPLEEEPFYTEAEKQVLAWSIVWEGTISVNRSGRAYVPKIRITNTEFELLTKIHEIARLGRISRKPRIKKGNRRPQKTWFVRSYYEVLFFLKAIKPYIYSYRKYKIAQLVIEFCQSRITKHESKIALSYTKRELEIVKEVRRLNRKGIL